MAQQIVNEFADQSDALLHRLAEETGGEQFRVTRKMPLQTILVEIAGALQNAYEIGYVPPSDTKVGQFHNLDLREKDPHMRVQSRQRFFAAP